jgi:acyl-CoA dehydrogenase family member 9
MVAEGFLEKLYAGQLDRGVFDAFYMSRDMEKIQLLVSRFIDLAREYPSEEIERAERIPADMLQKMGAMGLFGVSIPQAYGGLGFNEWETLSAVEKMVGSDLSLALVALAHLSIGCKGIVLFGTEEQKRKYLVPAASGKMIFSYALTEPLAGSDAKHIQTRAELSGDGAHYLLNGQKTYITNANYAGGLTVFAQMDPDRPGFMGAFIVETGWEGVKIGKDMPKMGLKASSTAPVQFKDVRVPVENLLGRPGDGFKIAMTILNYGRLGLGAASVGMMDRSLEDMLKRSSSRIQFGTPIRSFPLIQEKLVEAKVRSFVSSAMNDFTAYLLHADPTANVAIESSHCKLFGTTRGWDVTYDALQVAGGAGYLSTQPYEKRMRDFRVTTVFEGTSEIHSIYPALFLLRKLGKQMRHEPGKLAAGLRALKDFFKRQDCPLELHHKAMRKAAKLVRANAAAVRRLLLLSLFLHGKKAPEREFSLRRITSLSLYAYATLAVLARMAHGQKAGTFKSEEVALLSYFVEEGKAARKLDHRGILTSRKERLHDIVVGNLFKKDGDPLG